MYIAIVFLRILAGEVHSLLICVGREQEREALIARKRAIEGGPGYVTEVLEVGFASATGGDAKRAARAVYPEAYWPGGREGDWVAAVRKRAAARASVAE